jgi:adenosylcobinamide-GDP ribazoletransferase
MNSLVRALALFTVLPVRRHVELTREGAAAALRWLPLVGAALGAVAGLPLAAVREWAPHAQLLGAVLSVCLVVLLTRALHLDGLADTADGLGSRAPAARALEIMRRSDIGPFGVLAIALVVLADVAALAALPGGTWAPVAALALAAAAGRVAVLAAASRGVPPAHADGFGAFVAGSVAAPVLAAEVVLLLAAAAARREVAGVVAPAAALLVCVLFVAHVVRRLGGVTGDVFGALIELGTALTLAGLTFS